VRTLPLFLLFALACQGPVGDPVPKPLAPSEKPAPPGEEIKTAPQVSLPSITDGAKPEAGKDEPIPAATGPEEPARKPTAQKDEPPLVIVRHILVAYQGAERATATRSKEEAKARAGKILALARQKGTDFADLAKYSDEPGAGERGGSLGPVMRGQGLAKPFEDASFLLGEGQVSDLVETEFGYHIIQREFAYAMSLIIVLISNPEIPDIKRTKEEAKARAGEAVAKIKGGMSFDAAAKEYSDEPTAKLGVVASEVVSDSALSKELREPISALKPGEVSAPIERPFGFFILKKEPLAWADAAHILIRYKGALGAEETVTRSKEDAKKRAEEAAAKAKTGDFAALAKEYSEDAASKDQGGDISPVIRGKDPSILIEPILALTVGQISAPVESPFGYHIFKRLPPKAKEAPKAP
jgi:peptidyl-prolyl cis-trans isomerase NIMA-interacting 1